MTSAEFIDEGSLTPPADVGAEHAAGESRRGRVRFVLRIGVTGHINLPDEEMLVPAVHEALRRIRKLLPAYAAEDTALVVMSSLAEGADRLVTRVVLTLPGSRLETVLPLGHRDYARDFSSPASRAEFRALLKQSATVRQGPPKPTREAAYEWAGRSVADRCDALIAIWDGEPSRGRGGTAEIVEYARQQGVPMAWVHVDGEVTDERMAGEAAETLWDAARDVREFNTGLISDSAFETGESTMRRHLGLGTPRAPGGPLGQACEELSDWFLAYFVRADIQAIRVQARFRTLSTAMFTMAAAAVAVVAIQTTFLPTINWIAGIEVLLLAALLVIPLLRRRLRLHERWTSSRFLAQRLRSAYFLALAGTTDRAKQTDQTASFADPSVAWIERALAEITAARPQLDLTEAEVEPLRNYLSEYWIGGQVCYFSKASRKHEKLEVRLRHATGALFGITLVSAILHMLGVGRVGTHGTRLAELLIVLSISVPAIGAAAHGIETQRQYRRHAQRFSRMLSLLGKLNKKMLAAQDLGEVRNTAAEVERIMREESNDWFGAMRFHDIELIT